MSDYESFDKVIDFVSGHWEKRKVFFDDYKMVYPRLISSIKWKFDYVFFEKKKKKMQRQQNILEQLCDKIVDFMGETFTKKYYLVKISQSKKGHVYFVVRKKEGDCLVTNCLHFIARFMKFPGAYFFGLVVSLILLINISFFFLFFLILK